MGRNRQKQEAGKSIAVWGWGWGCMLTVEVDTLECIAGARVALGRPQAARHEVGTCKDVGVSAIVRHGLVIHDGNAELGVGGSACNEAGERRRVVLLLDRPPRHRDHRAAEWRGHELRHELAPDRASRAKHDRAVALLKQSRRWRAATRCRTSWRQRRALVRRGGRCCCFHRELLPLRP